MVCASECVGRGAGEGVAGEGRRVRQRWCGGEAERKDEKEEGRCGVRGKAMTGMCDTPFHSLASSSHFPPLLSPSPLILFLFLYHLSLSYR